MPLGPEEVKDRNPDVEKYFDEIDKQLTLHHHRCEDNIFVLLEGELTKEERQKIVIAYIKAGWSKVTSQTSSENGERPGLTKFKMYY
jgi:hypothetical protein